MKGVGHKLIVQVGDATIDIVRDSLHLILFTGETISEFFSALRHPSRIRRKETLYYMNLCGANAFPVRALPPAWSTCS